ncbi:MAG TPA: threonine ammonia-lyase, partial [Chloroflexi bacterium]|nr:threonine ammonia-lyase [Chloroflexota bacterium]
MSVAAAPVAATSVAAAAAAIAGRVERTPFVHSPDFSALAGCEVHLKLENLQRTGAFKLRGAMARLLALDGVERARGVVTASAGNHGQGVAVAAAMLAIRVCVVLPRGVPLAKLTAIQRAGADVVVTGDGYDEAFAAARELAAQRGAVYIHAFDDPTVIAGQGTVAREMLEDLPDLDAIVVPVGGGGLAAGVAIAVSGARPAARVVGAQAETLAAFAASLAAGYRVEPGPAQTMADGIAVAKPGELAFSVLSELADRIVTVSEENLSRALLLCLERAKQLVEPAGAAAVAALLESDAAEDL